MPCRLSGTKNHHFAKLRFHDFQRQQQAQKRDRFVNPLFFQARISRISSYTIRAVQNAIITGMSLQCFMSSLVARLVSRPQLIGEH
ncbi:hypothetical protein [Bathymodiolus japonicus methanotrophic gill symbiont]|uniref:hypothetical protein n=1 Tax=Bathymodiolus japonicus methanotrophic gill symbiont TaxID=113269 RepID=UPI001C8E33BF|nr:hypothetical protein [Bathymodiolus japonicus methanotrophic gill symbiont]